MNLFKLSSIKTNLPPGTLKYTGTLNNKNTYIKQIIFDENNFDIKNIPSIQELVLEKSKNNWIDIIGATNPKIIEEIGKKFDIPILYLEDILSINQNPKIEFYKNSIFIVFKVYQFKNKKIEREQICFFINKNNLFTFQENEIDTFSLIKTSIDINKFILKNDINYLIFSLIDFIVDNYHKLISDLYDEMENLEISLFDNNVNLENIYNFRTEIIKIKLKLWHIIEIINELIDYYKSNDEFLIFYNDLLEKLNLYYDELKHFDEKSKNLIEIYVAISGDKMNNIMKFLTIISSLFVPLSFLTGVYGMNFHYIPGLEYKYSFFILLGFMILITIIMLIIFKKRKWF
ncbi:MAG: magnesium transporter [Fusobacteriaceae bacterium]|jgi:magnesium transporter|nr:magnesium and cobalt transport protein CorA [Fusobacteriales bacterium]MDN5304042.1 magnesium transporter [Fusobacteriaceae bacterium]